ncbi:hypothetical protein AKO1_007894 [Acrasis kona]|uniref:Uncharacterized protein n=1 Tax=Acrasis kona TaxID=1008807 RepID=A0AAW2YNI5_9EUKA
MPSTRSSTKKRKSDTKNEPPKKIKMVREEAPEEEKVEKEETETDRVLRSISYTEHVEKEDEVSVRDLTKASSANLTDLFSRNTKRMERITQAEDLNKYKRSRANQIKEVEKPKPKADEESTKPSNVDESDAIAEGQSSQTEAQPNDEEDWESHDTQTNQSLDESILSGDGQVTLDSQILASRLEELESQQESQKQEEKETVEITIKKGEVQEDEKDESTAKKRRTNPVKRKTKEDRSIEVLQHETSLLIFLSYHLKRCQLSDGKTLQSVMLSLVPDHLHFNQVIEIQDDDDDDDSVADSQSSQRSKSLEKRKDAINIKKLVDWFDSTFVKKEEKIKQVTKKKKKVVDDDIDVVDSKKQDQKNLPYTLTEENLIQCVQNSHLQEKESIIVCASMLKSLGYICRFVVIIDPDQQANQSSGTKSKKKPIKNNDKKFVHNELWLEIYSLNLDKWIQVRGEVDTGSFSKSTKTVTKNFLDDFKYTGGSAQNMINKFHYNKDTKLPPKESPKAKSSPSQSPPTKSTQKEHLSVIEEPEKNTTIENIIRRTCTLPTFVVGVTTHQHECIIQDLTALHYMDVINNSTIIGREQYAQAKDWFLHDVIESFNNRISFKAQINGFEPLPIMSQILKRERDIIDGINDMINREFPSKIDDYKKHPLYCIDKFIGKYEALYPEDVKPVGKIGEHDIYEKKYLKPLHTRDKWLKEGRKVAEHAIAYKSVKASHASTKENTDLFGEWQTLIYVAPTAVDGIVPKNERGQVDLWHERMLPKKTVHLNIRGIGKVAKKLNIDYAPAMTGFEIRGGRSVPTIEGVVVCEEFEQVLRDAAIESERIRLKKVRERIELRVVKNWRRLTLRLMAVKEVNEMYKHLLDKEVKDENKKKEDAEKKKRARKKEEIEEKEQEYEFEEEEEEKTVKRKQRRSVPDESEEEETPKRKIRKSISDESESDEEEDIKPKRKIRKSVSDESEESDQDANMVDRVLENGRKIQVEEL